MYPPLYPPRLTLGSATLFNPDVGLDVPRSHCASFVIALKFAHVFFRRCTSSLWASLPSSFLGLFLHTCRHLIRLFWECVFFLPPTAFHVIFSLVGRLPLSIFSLCIHFVNGKIARIGVSSHSEVLGDPPRAVSHCASMRPEVMINANRDGRQV